MTPPKWADLPQQQQLEYLLGGKIKQADWYINGIPDPNKHVYGKKEFSDIRQKIHNREVFGYGETDTWLYEALDLCPIQGAAVAVMGSTVPTYELITLEFGGKPTTIEYNLPGYNHPEIEEILVQE